MSDALELIEALLDDRPAAGALAEVLSLVVRAEPELIRQARLMLARERPEIESMDAAAEADLWFSGIVATEGPTGIVLDAEVAEILQQRLAEDQRLLELSWNLIVTMHRDEPWSIRVEEFINWHAASGEDEKIEDLLLAAGGRLADAGSAKDPARWLMRALLRLPARARQSEAGRLLEVGAGARLDRRVTLPETDLDREAVSSWLPWLLPQGLPRVALEVRMSSGVLDIAEELDPPGESIELPDTDPLLLEVSWHDGTAPQQRHLQIREGEERRFPVSAKSVELRTVDGARCRLGYEEEGGVPLGGIDFSAVRALHRPFYAREEELEELMEQTLGESAFATEA